MRWYEGDQLTSETAEDIRDKLSRISLNTRNTASEFINDFLEYQKHLDELDESYIISKTVSIFLDQITDSDYEQTIGYCLEGRLPLEECIERIRAKERRLTRERQHRKRSALTVRRTGRELDKSQENEIDLKEYVTERGFYSVPSDIWNKLSENDKKFVREFNGKLRKRREENDPS